MIIKKYFMKSMNRITKDFRQKELLPLKLVFFVQASTISVLYPYLTIHMRELGISVEEAAIMSAVIPVIGIIMPPLAGMVADKIGNFKLLLAFFSFIGGAAALLLLLVPVGRITVTYPQRITMSLECDDADAADGRNQYLNLGFSDDHTCDLSHRLNGSKEFNLDTKLETCGFVCRSSNQSARLTGDDVLRARSYTVQMQQGSVTASYHHLLTKEDLPSTQTKEDVLCHRNLANDGHLATGIRRVAVSEYFFPENDLSSFKCNKISGDSEGENKGEEYVCSVGIPEDETWESVPNANKTIKFGWKNLNGELSEPTRFKSEFFDWSGFNKKNLDMVACRSTNSKEKNISVFVHLYNPENNLEVVEILSLEVCTPRCLVSTLRKSACTNLKEEVEFDPWLTFWIYLVIRVFIGIIGSTSYAMYEVAVIAILREQKADYGLQRIYASIGGMISSPLSGWLIDYASQGKGYTDFRPAFYLYAGLKTGTSILMLFINLEFKQAASNVIADAINVLKNLEIIALLIACFVLGTAWGYIESFLFWFLEDLGGTRSLMGITITVGGIAGIPLLVLSGPIIDKIGHANVLFIGFVFYAIRLVGYSIIYNPYHCLFFEAMESITSSLAITAAVTYAAKLSTTTTDGSVQGLVGGVYFGVGRGAGSLIGGYLMKAFGTRSTYRTFSVFTLITGVFYYLFNQFYLRKRPQTEGNEICKKEPKKDPEVKIIMEKPKTGNKEYGAIQVENNNMRSVKGAEKTAHDNEGFDVKEEKEGEEEKKKQEKEKEKKEHSNPGYVPDEEIIDNKAEGETKKKED